MARVYVHSEADDRAVALTASAGETAGSLAARAAAALAALGAGAAADAAALALAAAPGGAPLAEGDALPACVDLFAVPAGGGARNAGAATPASASAKDDEPAAELLKQAQGAFQAGRFAAAKQLYESLLSASPSSYLVHVALVSCELAAGRAAAALKRLAAARKLFRSDAYLQVLLGDAHGKGDDWDSACEAYDGALRAARAGGDDAASLQALEIKLDDLRIKRARALFLSGLDEGEACDEIMKVLDATQQTHPAALLEYARVCSSRGRDGDAVQVLLRLVVKAQGDQEVRAELAKSARRAGTARVLTELGGDGAKSAAAVAFLATVLRENGALDECLELYRVAVKGEPGMDGATYALNLFHCLENANRLRESLVGAALPFFRHNAGHAWLGEVAVLLETLEAAPEFGAGGLRKGRARQDGQRWHDAAFDKSAASSAEVGSSGQRPLTVGSDAELNALALLFACVKVLYLTGCVERARALCAVAARAAEVTRPRPLHETLIRNEHAFYLCAKQLMDEAPPPPLPDAAAGKAAKPLYVLGDSHCMPLAWRRVSLHGEERLLVPMLVTGLKQWHLRKGCTFYTREQFERVASSVPDASDVLALFGEIDCREGLGAAVKRGIYESVEKASEEVTKIYTRELGTLTMARKLRILVHDVAPVLAPCRETVATFNAVLARAVAAARAPRLQLVAVGGAMLDSESGELLQELNFDQTHLHPCYVESILQPALDELID